jgi:hypothetical protein
MDNNMYKLADARSGILGFFDDVIRSFKTEGLRKALKDSIKLKLKVKKGIPQLTNQLIFSHGINPSQVAKTPQMQHRLKVLRDLTKEVAQQKDSIRNAVRARNTALGLTAGGGALALGAGATFAGMKDSLDSKEDKERKKIETSLALQELQSDTGTEASAFGKESASKDLLPMLGLGAGLTAGAAIPAYMAFKYLKDIKAGKQKKLNKEQIDQYRAIYDQKFRESILDEMNVDPERLEEAASEISKSAGLGEFIKKYPLELGAAALGIGMGTGAFLHGKKQGDDSSENLAKMKTYREMLDRVTRLRNAPVTVTDGPFTPEEMLALEKLRKEGPAPKKEAAPVAKYKEEDTKEPVVKEEPKKVSADTEDEDLNELLGSI